MRGLGCLNHRCVGIGPRSLVVAVGRVNRVARIGHEPFGYIHDAYCLRKLFSPADDLIRHSLSERQSGNENINCALRFGSREDCRRKMHGIAFLGDELMKVSNDSGRWDNAAAVTEPLAILRRSWEAAVQKATSSPGDQNLHVKYKVLVDEGDGGPSSLHGPSGKTPPSQQTPPGVAPWWPDDGPEWTALTNGGSGNQSSEMQSLRAPLDAARMISDDWDRYDLGPSTGAIRPATCRRNS